MKFIFLLTALVSGAVGTLQAGLNNKVGRAIGDPVYAALISFVVGTAGLFCYALLKRMPFGDIRNAFGLHWSVWCAGLLGAFFVSTVILVTPRLGTTMTFSLVVAGQLTMAVFLDHFGLLDIPVHPFNWQRFAGILLITAGAVLIRKF